jgi:iron complex transport system substrate-binding protein
MEMKVCSFLPAATSMIYAMGLQEFLHGVTFECHAEKPRVVRSYLEDNHYTSEEIDHIVSDSIKQGKSLYYIDMELLNEIKPDIIFTQHVCDVCQIGTSYVEQAIAELDYRPRIVPLVPRRLNDVYDNILTIAQTLGQEEAGNRLLGSLKQRTDVIVDRLRASRTPQRRVMIMEWMEPIYNCGHWIPDQIAGAGAVDMLSNPAGYSIVTPWEKIRQYDPEVLVIAPCGFNIERSRTEIETLTGRPDWNDLTAVRNGEVYLADADMFTQPSHTLVDGIELLASLFHPNLFPIPERLRKKVLPLGDRRKTLGAAR